MTMPGGPGSVTGLGLMHALGKDRANTEKGLSRGLVLRIAGYASRYRRPLGVFVVLTIIDGIITASYPLVFRIIIDDGVLKHAPGVAINLAILAALLALVDCMLTIAQRWISAQVGERLMLDLRSAVFARLTSMPIGFFARIQKGALISRLNNDIADARQAFTDVLSSAVGSLITAAVTLTVMAFLSWKVTLMSLTLLPFFTFSARRMGRRVALKTRDHHELNAKLNNAMIERFNVSGAMLMHLFGTRHSEVRLLTHRAAKVHDVQIVLAMSSRIFLSALVLSVSLATALTYGWGGALAAHGTIEVGTLVALGAYLARLYGPITALSNVQLDVATAMVSFDRIFEIVDLRPLIQEIPNAVPLSHDQTSIEFDHVNFTFPGVDEISLASLETVDTLSKSPQRQILHDVSFTIREGEVVALVGPSGAGKTTIANLIPRLYDVESGQVRVNGVDVRSVTLDSLREVIGVVNEEPHLFHDSIRANLLYARPEADEDDLQDALSAAQILPLVRSFPAGLDTVVGDRGYRLSGGERQRIAIARLLLKAPDIVILDEATAHLDSETESKVQRALRSALSGRTALVIAHRLSTVREADFILVVSGGRIVERGVHNDLLSAGGPYAELCRAQFSGRCANGCHFI